MSVDDLFHSKVEDDQKKLKEMQRKGLDHILSKAEVTKEEYYEALKVSKNANKHLKATTFELSLHR